MKVLSLVLGFVGLMAAFGFLACSFLQPPPYVTWPVWGLAMGAMISSLVIHGRHP